MRFIHFPTLLALAVAPACSDDPSATGTARYRSEAKTTACIAWCERERVEGCKDASPRLDDCPAYCSGAPGCGDAGPLLACVEANPDAILCDSERLRYAPACVVEAKTYLEGAEACDDDTGGVSSHH